MDYRLRHAGLNFMCRKAIMREGGEEIDGSEVKKMGLTCTIQSVERSWNLRDITYCYDSNDTAQNFTVCFKREKRVCTAQIELEQTGGATLYLYGARCGRRIACVALSNYY